MRACLLAAFLSVGCGGASLATEGASTDAVITVRGVPPAASIWVDGRFVAEVGRAKGGVAVAPGKHRIEIRHDNHHSHYQLLELRARERRTLTIELAEELP